MSEYTGLPVSHIGAKFAVGPGGVYVRGDGPLDVRAKIETGELSLVEGNNYNVNRLFLTLRETHGVDVLVEAKYYSGSTQTLYTVEHLAPATGAADYAKERNVALGRGPDGNGWIFTVQTPGVTGSTGSWELSNFELQINRARKPKR
jgi:hypothetical protein